ncbi:Hypothetical predicted protein [Cloeon dipterum]|uniref:SYO1-like TPR repeats domain-containing protein n=2 Tax=Cloeon dipterum TaxID=197152 RepID=A0A8S1D314_9INSE|nr:Hypothetical predicted protein [Cloeon dipterum]
MGKYKNNRGPAKKTIDNVIRRPTMGQGQEASAGEISLPLKPSAQTTLPTLLKELAKGSEDDKIRSLLGISCLENVTLDKKGLRSIAPLLNDSSNTVQVAAANALRMLAMSGGSKVANDMIDDDIMTPLETVMYATYGALFSGKTLLDDKIIKERLVSCIKLLWTLSENSERALQFASKPRTMNVLISCAECIDDYLALPAVQCLQTITEDNTEAIQQLTSRQKYMLDVLALESTAAEKIQLQTLFASVIVNVHNCTMSRVLPATLITVVGTLAKCLKINILSQLEAFDENNTKKCPATDKEEMDIDEVFNESKENDPFVKEILDMGLLIDAQVCALETLANICTNNDDDEEMNTSESSEDAFSESEIEDGLCSNIQSLTLPPTLSSEVVSSILQNGILALTMEKAQPVPEELLSRLAAFIEEEDIPNRLKKLQNRALLCLHNLIRGLPLEELGGAQQLQETWRSLAVKIVTEWDSDAELLEAATSSLRALSSRLAEEKGGSSLIQEMSTGDLEKLCKLAEGCQDASVRINIYRVLSSISAIVSLNFSEKTAPLILTAGKFLLEQSTKETEIVVIAEALDALMDALSEDCSDAACAEMKLVARLRDMVPALKHKIHSQRRQAQGYNPVVSTVKTNLQRFIKYKAQRLC